MIRPTIGWSLSAPWHFVHSLGLPFASVGSVRRTILPNSLPPWSYTCTSDTVLPLFSSTVFHAPSGESAATAVAAPTTRAAIVATSRLIMSGLHRGVPGAGGRGISPLRRRQRAEELVAQLEA